MDECRLLVVHRLLSAGTTERNLVTDQFSIFSSVLEAVTHASPTRVGTVRVWWRTELLCASVSPGFASLPGLASDLLCAFTSAVHNCGLSE